METAQSEISRGERFGFGRNWQRFIRTVDESHVREATLSLSNALGSDRLDGRSFLDAGCGSGLFSLGAVRLGAHRVRSFDFDPDSTACTQEVKGRWAPAADHWVVSNGSVLDTKFLEGLGAFDVVYSWGVLHHTGAMWEGLSNLVSVVSEGGVLIIAIYNDQGWRSRGWLNVKRLYCSGPLGRVSVLAVAIPIFSAIAVASGIRRSRNPLGRFRDYRARRGMSIFHDWIDWLGGLPFECATPEEVIERVEASGFRTETVTRTKGWGCNEFVFRSVEGS